jgi:hypothetical protein
MELDTRGIVQVIQACAKGGVSSFKLNGLEITFSKNSCTMGTEPQGIIGPPSPTVDYKPVSAEDEALIKQIHSEELLISDPLAYENSALGEDESDEN